jgi:hypothetical protein
MSGRPEAPARPALSPSTRALWLAATLHRKHADALAAADRALSPAA